ncbi:MAG: PRC-barrel domain-containing protein [Sneathiellaceae bacterium]
MMRNLLAATAAAALLAGSTLAFAENTATGTEKMPSAAATDSTMPAKSPSDGSTSAETLPMDKPMDEASDATAAPATDSAAAPATDSTTMPATDSAAAPATDATAAPTATAAAGQPVGGFVSAQSGTDTLASNMIGQTVVNPQNETVGDVDDLVMDRSGRVTAAVIGVGGFLGIGEKSVGVPIESLSPQRTEDGDVQLVTMLSREELEQAPEFVDLETRAARDAEAARAAQQQQVQEQAQQPPRPANN